MNAALLKAIDDLEEWHLDTPIGEDLEQDLGILISRTRLAAEHQHNEVVPEMLVALIEIDASIVKFCCGYVPESVEFYSALQKVRAAIAKAQRPVMTSAALASATGPAVAEPICRVINNNQPGWTNIVETAPNVTLFVGDPLYSKAVVVGLVEDRQIAMSHLDEARSQVEYWRNLHDRLQETVRGR